MTRPLWTSEEAAKATGGTAVGEWEVDGLSIDTRSLQPGDMFVPLKDVRDGHEFIPQARASCAGAILSERPTEAEPALIVADTLKAMRDMAVAARQRSKAVRIGVTGSVGKTSLKEAIALICEAEGVTHKSLRSFNNHWGMPLTLATMPQNTDYGVFEMGMNHAGELADLSPLVAPNIAIISKIAPAHLAHFNSVDEIAAAKAEIFEGLADGGTAILNADDAYFDYLSGKAREADANIISFGSSDGAYIQLLSYKPTEMGLEAELRVDGRMLTLTMSQTGRHWAENAACAVAATKVAGIEPEVAVKALSSLGGLPGRGEVVQINYHGKPITLLDESYNANPTSMRVAISALAARAKGRKLAVLGDMRELGATELDLHAALSEPLEAAGVSRVIVLGECMRMLRGALPREMRGAWVKDWEEAHSALLDEIQAGDTILIKGSNSMGLGKLVATLKEQTGGDAHVV